MAEWKSFNTDQPLIKYIADHSLRLSPAQAKLIKLTLPNEDRGMLGAPESLQLLKMLCKVIGAKKTLDIGVFTGFSALSIAETLPDDGVVYAFDISEENVNIGKPIWKEAGVYNKIKLVIGSAVESLEKLLAEGQVGTFDFAFIDADKTNYDNYYELSLKLLRSGGLIGIDNVLWSGKVMDPKQNDPDTCAIRALNTKIAKDDRVDINMLFVGDGLTLAIKK
ncbi:hypothetical protein LSH36_816g00028 [Paralvinella palmiformis]|uniref:Caffeoyl-CoA O-methyltransferase n=1 Tax=Paralvinella palmiformis TaxID=53620 RepID=A0AAD9MS53_9ANNE|nr:hypothetical protein LSH36_816g00028 [Paralvinella palmiformis]